MKDRRLLRRSAERPAITTCLLILALLTTGGCAGSSATSSDPEILTDSGAVGAYSAATEQLTLPPKVTWPPLKMKDDKYSLAYRGKDVVSVAQNYWLCSWQRAWVADFGKDQKGAAEALTQLRTFPRMAEYTSMYDSSTRSAFDARLVEAGLGDPSSMRQDVKVNC